MIKFFTLITLSLLVFFIIPDAVSAQQTILDDGFCSGTDCSACDLVLLANNLIGWLIGTVMVLFAVLAVWAGFGLVTSGGNPSALSDAKSKFVNAFIGLLIVLSAWIIVDTLMRGLVGTGGQIEGYGPWSQVYCARQAETSVTPGYLDLAFSDGDVDEATQNGAFTLQYYTYDETNVCREGFSRSFSTITACVEGEIAIPSGAYLTSDCGNASAANAPSWITAPICGVSLPDSVIADPTADGSFSYQSGIAAQRAHASPALEAVLSCMEQIVPGNVGQISSISDSSIVNGSKTWAQCRLEPRSCAHVTNSRHYGGSAGSRGNMSWAVDFGDEQNNSILCAAAHQCGAIADCGIHNGNHTHLSVSY